MNDVFQIILWLYASMKLKRIYKIFIAVVCIILGWILNAIAWTVPLGGDINTALLIIGLAMFMFGIISLFILMMRKMLHKN